MAAMADNGYLKFFDGDQPEDGTLHFLLVSTSQYYLDEMQKHIFLTTKVQQKKRNYQLKVHTCKNLSDVLHLNRDGFRVDFVIFVVDVKNDNCLIEIQKNLKMMDSSFRRERICLVNPNPSYEKSIVKPFDLWDFAHHYQINIINGKISDPEKVLNICKRILNLAEACCGVLNGIPLVGYV